MKKTIPYVPAIYRIVAAIIGGLVIGLFVGKSTSWMYAPLAVWDSAALIFLVWVWFSLYRLDAAQTAAVAVKEDPSRALSDIILVIASIMSLGAVGLLLTSSNKLAAAVMSVVSVVISWAIIHTIYTLKYAESYYGDNPSIDFNSDEAPCYSDFAYIGFTIGMTFQVSDNNFKTSTIRRIALKHALLGYLFGTVIVASMINLVAGLGK